MFSFFSYQAFMSLCGMLIESRPVSLVLPESPHVVVCCSWLIDSEGGLVSNRKRGKICCLVPESLRDLWNTVLSNEERFVYFKM